MDLFIGGDDRPAQRAGWSMEWPRHFDPAVGRVAFAFLRHADVPPATIVGIFRSYGVVFRHRGQVFVPVPCIGERDVFLLLGVSVAVAAPAAVLVIVLEWLEEIPWRAALAWLF
ncbi:MAG TPA: hypothetical protein VFB29_05120 [Pseudolabrys sp.]|nr:hypothetical protein [Pseudolabrys sp.]